MINLTWQDDGFGNLVFTPQDAWEFNMQEYFYGDDETATTYH